MNISTPFNGFYHKVILVDFHKRCNIVKFPGWVDAETGEALEWVKGENFDSEDIDDLKQILKNMCSLYPLDGDKKISTRKIDSKSLCFFIEWVFRIAAYNHIEMEIVEREWRELLKNN